MIVRFKACTHQKNGEVASATITGNLHNQKVVNSPYFQQQSKQIHQQQQQRWQSSSNNNGVNNNQQQQPPQIQAQHQQQVRASSTQSGGKVGGAKSSKRETVNDAKNHHQNLHQQYQQQLQQQQQAPPHVRLPAASASVGSNFVVNSILPPGQMLPPTADNQQQSNSKSMQREHLQHQLQQRPPSSSRHHTKVILSRAEQNNSKLQQFENQQQNLVNNTNTNQNRNFYPPVSVQQLKKPTIPSVIRQVHQQSLQQQQYDNNTSLVNNENIIDQQNMYMQKIIAKHQKNQNKTLQQQDGANFSNRDHKQSQQQAAEILPQQQSQTVGATPSGNGNGKDFSLYMARQRSVKSGLHYQPLSQSRISQSKVAASSTTAILNNEAAIGLQSKNQNQQTKSSQQSTAITTNQPQQSKQLLKSTSQGKVATNQSHSQQALTPTATAQGAIGSSSSSLIKRIPPVGHRSHHHLVPKQSTTPQPVLGPSSIFHKHDHHQQQQSKLTMKKYSGGMGAPVRSQADLLANSNMDGRPTSQTKKVFRIGGKSSGGNKVSNKTTSNNNNNNNAAATSNAIISTTGLNLGSKVMSNFSVVAIDRSSVSRTIDYEAKEQRGDLIVKMPHTNDPHSKQKAQPSSLQTLQPFDPLISKEKSNTTTALMTREVLQKQQKRKLERQSIETKSARNLKQALLESISYDRVVDSNSNEGGISSKQLKKSIISKNYKKDQPTGGSVPTALIMRQKFYEKNNKEQVNSSIESQGQLLAINSNNNSVLSSGKESSGTQGSKFVMQKGVSAQQLSNLQVKLLGKNGSSKMVTSISSEYLQSPAKQQKPRVFNEDLENVQLAVDQNHQIVVQQLNGAPKKSQNGSQDEKIINQSQQQEDSSFNDSIIKPHRKFNSDESLNSDLQIGNNNNNNVAPITITHLVIASPAKNGLGKDAVVLAPVSSKRNMKANDTIREEESSMSFYNNNSMSESILPQVHCNSSNSISNPMMNTIAYENLYDQKAPQRLQTKIGTAESSSMNTILSPSSKVLQQLPQGIEIILPATKKNDDKLDNLDIQINLEPQTAYTAKKIVENPQLLQHHQPLEEDNKVQEQLSENKTNISIQENDPVIQENLQGTQGQSIAVSDDQLKQNQSSLSRTSHISVESRNQAQSLRPNTQIETQPVQKSSTTNKDQISPQDNRGHGGGGRTLQNSKTNDGSQLQTRHGTNLFSFGNITPEFYEQQAIMLEKKPSYTIGNSRQNKKESKRHDPMTGPESSYMVESATLYRNSERDKQILILPQPRSRASSRTDQQMNVVGTAGIYEAEEGKFISRTTEDDFDGDADKASMRTADFQKHSHVANIGKLSAITAPPLGAYSKQSTNKTPKFLLSPRTNSLANTNVANSLMVADGDASSHYHNDQDYQERHGTRQMLKKMLDSQTSDEVFKVVNDFHQKNHRIIVDRESMDDDDQSRGSSYGLGPEYTDDDEDGTMDLFLDSADLVEPQGQPEWQARKLQNMKNSNSNIVTLARPQQHHIYYGGAPDGQHENISYYNLPKKAPVTKQRGDGSGMVVFHQQQQQNKRSKGHGGKQHGPASKQYRGAAHQGDGQQHIEVINYRFPHQSKTQHDQHYNQYYAIPSQMQQNQMHHQQQYQYQQQLKASQIPQQQAPKHPLISHQSKQTEAVGLRRHHNYPQSTTNLKSNKIQSSIKRGSSQVHLSSNRAQYTPSAATATAKPKFKKGAMKAGQKQRQGPQIT